MRHLKLIRGGAADKPAVVNDDLATYRIESARVGNFVEITLYGPARPEGLLIASIDAGDRCRVGRAELAAREFAEERNFDLAYGAMQALARVNRAVESLVVSANRPVVLDYERGPRNGGPATKLCVDYVDDAPQRSCASDYVRAIFDAAKRRAELDHG